MRRLTTPAMVLVLLGGIAGCGGGSGTKEAKGVKLAEEVEVTMGREVTPRRDLQNQQTCERGGNGFGACEDKNAVTSYTPNANTEEVCAETKDHPGYNWSCYLIVENGALREPPAYYLVDMQSNGCWSARVLDYAPLNNVEIGVGCPAGVSMTAEQERELEHRETVRGEEHERELG